MRKLLLPVLSLLLLSCQSANYGSSSTKPDYPKLGLLADRVAEAREAEEAAVEQLQETGEQLSELVDFSGTDPQEVVTATTTQYDNSVDAAVALGTAIAAVEETATTIFQEWQIELDAYTDPAIKADSQAKLGETWQRYGSTMQVLSQSEAKMQPLLNALNANVTFLRGNLNTSALESRKVELGSIKNDIDALIRKMNIAIDSCDAFLDSI
jgi:hypothetical protein